MLFLVVVFIIERREDVMVVVVDNKIYVIGGYYGNIFMFICEVLDFDNNEWDFMVLLSFFRYQVGVVVLNRKIYVCGGWSGNGFVISFVECYDVVINIWLLVMFFFIFVVVRIVFCNFLRKMMEKLLRKFFGISINENLVFVLVKDF